MRRNESSSSRKAARDGYVISTIRSGAYSGKRMIVGTRKYCAVAGCWRLGSLDRDGAEASVYDEQPAAA